MTHVLPQQIARLVMRWLVVLAFIGAAEGAFAQSPVWQEAHRLYTEQQDYEAALAKFTQDLKKKHNVDATFWIGNCHRMLGNNTKAMEWYRKTIKFRKHDPVVHLYIVEILMQGNDFKKAKSHLTEYKKKITASPFVVQRLLTSCDSGIVWKAKPTPGKLRNEDALNTPNNDWGASHYGNGIAFCSDRKISINTPYETDDHQLQRVLMAEASDESWTNVQAFERPVNGANFNAGPIAFFKDGRNFIAARSSGQPDLPSDKKSNIINHTGLYYSMALSDTTMHIMPFDYNNVIQYNVDGPCLSQDEQVLYFASNVPGGYGGFDIYFCLRNADGSWSRPQNCGDNINTSDDEVYPSLGADGTLYFASNGHTGMGGLDIFAAKGHMNDFGKPVNLGYPINSGTDDFSLLELNSEDILFSSNRSGGKGNSDIYSFTYDRSKSHSGFMPAAATSVADAASQQATLAKVKALLASEAAEPEAAQQWTTTTATTLSEPEPALALEEEVGEEFSLRIEVIDRYRDPLRNASIRLVDNTDNKYVFLTTDAIGTATANLIFDNEYALTVSKDGYVAVSVTFVMPYTDKRVLARLTLEPLRATRIARKAALRLEREAKRKQQATATQKPAAAAPKQATPRQLQPAPARQVQPQQQPQQQQPQQQQKTNPQQPQAKNDTFSAQPFGSFEIIEIEVQETKKERKPFRIFRR